MYGSLFSELLKSGVRFDNDDATGQTGQTQLPESGQPQKEGENNEKDNIEPFADLWDNPDTEKGENKDQKQQTQSIQQGPTNQEVFDDHIKSLDLMGGVDLEKITADLNNGSIESLNSAFGTLAKNVYTKALVNTNKIMDQKIAKAVEQAVEQSKTSFGSDFAMQQMNSQLPFTAKPAIAPMAKQVLEQLIKKGKSTEEAIKGVKDYFQQTASVFAKESGMVIAPKNRPGSGRFTETAIQNLNEDDADDDLPDFLKILGGEQEEA